MLTINHVAVAAPSDMRVEISESASAREQNLLGEAVMDVFGAKRALKLHWKHLSGDAAAVLFSAASPGFFPVAYPDPDGNRREIICYLVGRRADVRMMRGGHPVWTDIEMELMER